ncbi:sideroflexin-2-like [Centruroides sculpturatus]|uniref:sideroflexin-2-like n=1 Tax=Centruroides sculpturatus TaxID=218467 RepID=UPI000C6CD4FB|nr:sideroflexin-2-like [Centruroides sculpturatus]
MAALRIDLDRPRWDQSTFTGRLKHFFNITDPRTVFATEEQLDNAKKLLEEYKLGKEPPGTTEQQLWYAKKLYDSSFHPDSGDKQNIIGRMSFQVPGGMFLTGGMLQFYKTTSAVIFWQWLNQSFNAVVNYTNRNAKSPLTPTQIGVAYVSATTCALVTSIGLKSFLQKRASNLLQRYVPFAALAAANCVNIPLVRQTEWKNGIAVFDDNGNKVTESKLAAVKGITQVVISRIFMATPGMMLCPIIMEKLEKYPLVKKFSALHAPFQMCLVGVILIFMVPAACALFPQQCSLHVNSLKRWEPEKYKILLNNIGENYKLDYVYFNKGL